MPILDRLREWREERRLRPRSGDTTCRRCGGSWIPIHQEPERVGQVVPGSLAPTIRIGSHSGFVLYECGGCQARFGVEA